MREGLTHLLMELMWVQYSISLVKSTISFLAVPQWLPLRMGWRIPAESSWQLWQPLRFSFWYWVLCWVAHSQDPCHWWCWSGDRWVYCSPRGSTTSCCGHQRDHISWGCWQCVRVAKWSMSRNTDRSSYIINSSFHNYLSGNRVLSLKDCWWSCLHLERAEGHFSIWLFR